MYYISLRNVALKFTLAISVVNFDFRFTLIFVLLVGVCNCVYNSEMYIVSKVKIKLVTWGLLPEQLLNRVTGKFVGCLFEIRFADDLAVTT